MPEDLKVDCFECKDLSFARNLERSMKDGYGRWNSNLEFRSANHSELRPYAPGQYLRENQQARVIGRFEENAIRERWDDCEIGDAIPEANAPDEMKRHDYMVVLMKHKTMPIHYWPEEMSFSIEDFTNFERSTFEHVMMDLWDDDGIYSRTALWKRIS